MRTAALICVLVACDAGVKPEPPAPAKDEAPQTVISGINLAYLAASSDMIFHVDVAALRRNRMWPTYETRIAGLVLPKLGCTYAPVREVATVDVGITLETGLGVFVVRGIDRDRTLACLHRLAGARFDGDFVTVPGGRAPDVVKFVDATTMLMQRGKQPTKATLTEVFRDDNAPLAMDRTLAATIKRLPPYASVTTVSRPNSEKLQSTLRQVGTDFRYFFGSLDVIDKPEPGIRVQLASVLGTNDQATQFAAMMQTQLKPTQVNQLFDRFDIAVTNDTSTMQIAMSETKLASLVRTIDQMMPMVGSDP